MYVHINVCESIYERVFYSLNVDNAACERNLFKNFVATLLNRPKKRANVS